MNIVVKMTYIRPVNQLHNKHNRAFIHYFDYDPQTGRLCQCVEMELYAYRYSDITAGPYWTKAQKTYLTWCECPGKRDPQVARKPPVHWAKVKCTI